jgi:hypothetical protein
MNRLFLFGYTLRGLLLLVLFFTLFSSHGRSQSDSLKSTNICKQLAIQSAQLADQSHFYSEQSYFESRPIIYARNIDTAISLIKEAIYYMDSTISLASDSAIMALKYANIAKDFALKAQHALIQSKSNIPYEQRKQFTKRAIYDSENATIDAYHASFYFSVKKKKVDKKVDVVDTAAIVEKQLTKLDIDQTLFSLLNEDLKQKSEANKLEISKLADELFNTKDPSKLAELKLQLKNLQSKDKDLEKKKIDAQAKLASINTLLTENNSKTPVNKVTQKDTIFSKKITKKSDEWNKNFKSDSEMPDFLVYQVQLGVFKSDVIPETFKGLTPIYTKTTEKGISYSIGLFERMSDAQEAKKNVHGIGLKDAFIVAYYNKKKITLAEAAKVEKK